MKSGHQSDPVEDIKLFVQLADTLFAEEQNRPVSPYMDVQDLEANIDFELSEKPMSEGDYVAHLRDLIAYTPKTASRLFFNQLFGGRHSKAMLGELLAVLLNNSMYTYKAGGPQILLEQSMIDKMIQVLGFPEGAGGTMAPGGSMTNLMGMIMARDRKDRNVVAQGVQAKMTVYTSSESHYSVPKNAAFSGVGREQVRYVPVDGRGQMLVDELESMIVEDLQSGHQPFLINATAGTTVLGAFDPIDLLADIAEKYDIWLHVDGAYCGSVVFSQQYRRLIKGAERADSFTLNAHKMLSTPLSTSFILVRDGQDLYQSFSNDASYLFQTHDDDLNPGKKSLQCGRRNDALKFWTLWKAIGTRGLEEMVDHQFDLAEVARKYVSSNADYRLYSYEDSVSVCFNYKDYSPRELCNRMYQESEIMVGFGSFGEDTFVRLVTINSGNTEADILDFFERLEAFAKNELTAVEEYESH